MSRPYIPGVWANQYEKLPRARKDAVIREVNKIFAERTGITRKLDTKRDVKLVRIWLRIRDAVMAAGPGALGAGAFTRVFLRLDDVEGSSKDPRHAGWIDVSKVERPQGVAVESSRRLVVVLDEKQSPSDVAAVRALDVAAKKMLRAVLQYSSPRFVFTMTMRNVNIDGLRVQGSMVHVGLSPEDVQWESE